MAATPQDVRVTSDSPARVVVEADPQKESAKTGRELRDCLEKSGTGREKLEKLDMALVREPEMSARELYDAMAESKSLPETTLKKAHDFLTAKDKAEDEDDDATVPGSGVFAPPGGITVGEKWISGGAEVPESAIKKATAQQLRQLDSAKLDVARKMAEQAEEGKKGKRAKPLTAAEQKEQAQKALHHPTHPASPVLDPSEPPKPRGR